MFNRQVKLSDLQLMVMKVLWEQGKLSVSEVHRLLNEQKELALTTVATLLKRMHEKGVVDFEKAGRQHLYFPLVSEEEVKTSMLSNILANLFDGNPTELVHHLVGQSEVDEEELGKIKAILSSEGATKEGGKGNE
ncbi:BlaI/MecI/CopY family transcriptional regulator [Aliikangiella coralliicola]|nr:BlaI/MecI/CopY family transcriptional regulator [Aliikangiella coralliicola]